MRAPHGSAGNCLAATFTGYYQRRSNGTYRIYDADIVTNYAGFAWASAGESCSSEIYVEGVMVHEVGHMLGLGHSNVSGATMYPTVAYCSNAPASLATDDINPAGCSTKPAGYVLQPTGDLAFERPFPAKSATLPFWRPPPGHGGPGSAAAGEESLSMHRGIRSPVLALVLLLLASAAVQARPLRSLPPAGLLGDLWAWVSSVLGSWSKEGGTMDPDGLESGGMMDPDGRKEGSTMDPNGLQRQASPPGSNSESGGTMDPNG